MRTTVDGVVFDAVDEAAAVTQITTSAAAGWGGFVLTPNANILRQLRSQDNVEVAANADLVLADGMPIVWASRITGTPLPGRVTGSSLIWTLSAAAARERLPVLLVGGDPGVAERGVEVLTDTYPELEASWHFPPFGFERDEAEVDAIVLAIYESNARIVFVGLGFPKQERLILRLRQHFPDVWFVACGAALTFVAGSISRAPRWMQDRGFEWIHRLVNEPRRLGRRYLLEDLPFSLAMFSRACWLRAAVLARGLNTAPPASGVIQPTPQPTPLVLDPAVETRRQRSVVRYRAAEVRRRRVPSDADRAAS